jgi:hypothetical protein
MYLELWEVGLARLGGIEQNPALWGWLRRLYQAPAPEAQTFDSYLHEAGEPGLERRTRRDLSWWPLLEMVPTLPAEAPAWSPGSALVEGQGLALLRSADRYASLECGPCGGGHGHPDRLNLVLHADGEYWLPDFGTGSYVARDLFWYRSTLAHNAPRLDGVSQQPGDAVCENFDQSGDWAWARGRLGDLTRTLVSGPDYLVDVVELAATDDHVLELPWHFGGKVEVRSTGAWMPAEIRDDFVSFTEAQDVSIDEGRVLRACASSGAALQVHLVFNGELIRAAGPGAPGSLGPATFYVARARGSNIRLVTVLEPTRGTPQVRRVRLRDDGIEIEMEAGTERHVATVEGWEIRGLSGVTRLGGARRPAQPFRPLIEHNRPLPVHGVALPVSEPPALDGSLEGFDPGAPLLLDHEDQYRRSESPYPGPEEFSATVWINWNDDALYLAVEVVKPDICPRDPATPPLLLDNEPDEIHADGIQVYLRLGRGSLGYLAVPSTDGGIIARRVAGAGPTDEEVRGGWEPTDTGYRITLAFAPQGWGPFRPGDHIGFDLIVNQMLPGRQRRAGQLVWSGGGGWVWLRGDRQDPSRFGTLELR